MSAGTCGFSGHASRGAYGVGHTIAAARSSGTENATTKALANVSVRAQKPVGTPGNSPSGSMMPTSSMITGAMIAPHIPPAPNSPQNTDQNVLGFGLIIRDFRHQNRATYRMTRPTAVTRAFDELALAIFVLYNDIGRSRRSSNRGFGVQQRDCAG